MPRLLLLLMLFLLAACVATPVQQATAPSSFKPQLTEPPRQPLLRLETGSHTAMIRRIATDAAGRFVATASDDKTVRVWSLPDGRLLQVLRPPLADGDEGKLYTVAVSPDGQTIAAAGWTGWDWNQQASIYLFNRTDGSLRQRLNGLPDVIFDLRYSADGRYLAAALGTGGIRIYATATGREVFADSDYGSHSFSIRFDSTGRLLTTSWDSYVRLYSAEFRLQAKQKLSGGTRPYTAEFSPDGRLIAVGFEDSTAVQVLSVTDLSPRYAANTEGLTGGSLSSVTWSADGQTLYAGGMYNENDGSQPIFAWSAQGKGSRQRLSAANGTILSLQATADGLLFATADPTIGYYRDGQLAFMQKPQLADYRNVHNQDLRLSDDGQSIQFGYEYDGQHSRKPAQFELTSNRLSLIPSPSYRAADTSSLAIVGWEDTEKPTLNGKPLALKQYESSRSLAIAPDQQHFLLGTDWYLRYFAADGRERWHKAVPGTALAVNIAANNQLAVAGFGDGTLRWYRLQDGEELLALYPHPDGKRWVLWTPQGYYAASAGAEELIGWHVNHGKDQAADFFPVSRFREQFYRPDIISKVLNSLDVNEAVRLANEELGKANVAAVDVLQQLPPVVELLDPPNGGDFSQPALTVRYRVRSKAPVTKVKVLLDGRPYEQAGRGFTVTASDEQSLALELPKRDVEIAVIAENQFSASVPAIASLHYRGEPPKPAPAAANNTASNEFVIKPKLYVLAVGVSEYQQANLKLGFPAKDARDFAGVWQGQTLYRDTEVKLLANATKNDVLDGLDWLQKNVTQHDVAMVFMAGHGTNDSNGIYYFLPADVVVDSLKRSGVAYHDVKDTLTHLPGKVLMFLDTCHSGNIMGERRGAEDEITRIVNELSSAENGVVVFAASTGSQYSLESADWNNGAFTHALVAGLQGGADYTHDQKITINELDLFLSEEVKKLTNNRQTPTTIKPQTIQDFPIALK